MIAAFYLLTLVGLIGSFDVLYWHWYRLRLFAAPDARWENLTHAIRALLFAAMMLMVLHVDARGWWWPLYPLLLTFEVVNTMSDVIMEPRTRRNLGGLPAAEYILHIMLSLMTGAALASVIWGTRDLLWEPAFIGVRTLDVPLLPRIGAYGSVVVALGMFVFEMRGFFQLAPGRLRAQRAAVQAGTGR
jgi:hypothetical protein